MKPSSHLIQKCRTTIVELLALKKALHQKTAGAALDVFDSKLPEDLESIVLPNLMVTTHTSSNANDDVITIGRSAILHLKQYFLN